MAIVLLIVIALVLPAALLYLTLATNDFEKSTRALGILIQKRYEYEPPKKTNDIAKSMQAMAKPGQNPAGPSRLPSP
jgi:hypothetical protein